jgi:transcription elongation factor Elf1
LSNLEETTVFCCPHCLQHSAVTVTLVSGRHRFVEDCQVCCEPIEFDVDVREGELEILDYRSA